MRTRTQAALAVRERQAWLSGSGSLVVVRRVDGDRVSYERISGPGRAANEISAYYLIGSYRMVGPEGAPQ